MKYSINNEVPMVLISFDVLKQIGRIPCSTEHSLVDTVRYDDLLTRGSRSASLIVFMSHLWLSPSTDRAVSHPDFNGLKHSLLCRGLERIRNGLPYLDEIYIWIDYFCIDQQDDSLRSIGLDNLPGYLERCDVLFTPYTDEIYRAKGSSTEVPGNAKTQFEDQSEFSLFGRYRSLYEFTNRAWCRLEMFMGTHAPMPENGYEYFKKVGVNTRADRPHLFYGTWQDERGELPDPGPSISADFFRKLRPEEGLLTLESDRGAISKLVATIDVEEADTGYEGEIGGTGLPEGHGTMRYESGAVYQGEWKNGKHHGKGTFVYANGMRYIGNWKEGKRWGLGDHYLSNGLVFKGEFNNGASHGPGRLFYSSGNLKSEGTKNSGVWIENLLEYYPNGVLQFEGTIIDGERKGTEYSEDGTVIKRGIWRE